MLTLYIGYGYLSEVERLAPQSGISATLAHLPSIARTAILCTPTVAVLLQQRSILSAAERTDVVFVNLPRRAIVGIVLSLFLLLGLNLVGHMLVR